MDAYADVDADADADALSVAIALLSLYKVPFLLKHTLEIEFGPVNFHNRKCLAMKLILYTYKFK